jgi:WD40-like Beta Propeller Repeat
VATSGYVYDEAAFAFTTKLQDGAAYLVSVKTAPVGQSCLVYKGASGQMPIAARALVVGCEIINDLISRSSDNSVRGTYFNSSAPAIGGSAVPLGATSAGYGEGRFTVFVSNAAGMVSGVSNAHRQVYWHDALTGKTRLVSATAAGAEGDGDSGAPALSADGLTVAFESYASNLVAGDSNGVRDVFVWSSENPNAGVKRASVGTGGVEANSESFEPTLSGDGRVLAFASGASNLTAGVSGTSTINVYRRDLTTGVNTLVSAHLSTGAGVGGSKPALSEDGTRLAFYSFSSNIAAGDTNGLWDIFVYDARTGARTRVSLASGGVERNQGSESASREVAPAISGNGRYVAFATTASNMVAGDSNGAQDVFVVDTQTGSVVRASVDSAGAQGNADSPSSQGERPALSYDGAWVAFSSNASNLGAPAGNVLMRNWQTGQTRVLSSQTGSSVGPVSLSRTATYAAFGAGAQLDTRFASTGLFARFTGVGRAWFWTD